MHSDSAPKPEPAISVRHLSGAKPSTIIHAIDVRVPLTSHLGLPSFPTTLSEARDLARAEIVTLCQRTKGLDASILVTGEDPLRRSDLDAILQDIGAIRPEGLGLTLRGPGVTKAVAERLRANGLQRVLIPFHCARQEAHDWLVGESGALKAAHRAIRACLDAGLTVQAEIVLTRPTVAHLSETVELLAHTGVREICIRRLTTAEVVEPRFVPLSPRLSSLAGPLESTAALAVRRRLRLVLRDLPVCCAPRLRTLFAPPGSEIWLHSNGAMEPRTAPNQGCPQCPGAQTCGGAPSDYVRRFGWEEFADPTNSIARVSESVDDQRQPGVSAPMSLRWRGPSRVQCSACGDVPLGAQPSDSSEPTRSLREHLVQAASYRPKRLYLVGADLLAHPQSAQLIYDALRLFPHVEVAGEASGLRQWSDLDMRRIKDLQRLDVALYGPDAATHDAHCGIPGAFAAMQEGVERLRAQTSIPIGAYAILHDAGYASAFAEAWARGDLPGEPHFRLSEDGGDLDELADCAAAMAPGPARNALLSVLPYCLYEMHGIERITGNREGREARQTFQYGRVVPYEPCGSDPFGLFESCGDPQCEAKGCAGIAKGWRSGERSALWNRNI